MFPLSFYLLVFVRCMHILGQISIDGFVVTKILILISLVFSPSSFKDLISVSLLFMFWYLHPDLAS